MKPQPELEVFVRALHRRMVAVRALERTGLGLLAGCAVCLVLMPILLWRGEGTGALATAALCTGGIAGLIWAVARRPTRLQATMEADRQLGLSDLLGTALTIARDGRGGAMEEMVLAIADARCRSLSPSAIALHRLGARSWGGIALAGALVAGLGLFGGQTPGSTAQASGPRTWQEMESAQDAQNSTHIVAPDLRRSKPGGGQDDDPSSANQTTSQDSTGANAKTSATNNGAGSAEQGSGAGSAVSASKGNSGAHHDAVAGGNTAGGIKTGNTAGGGGSAATEGGTGTASGTAGGTTAARHVPVWSGQGWPAAQDAAREAIRVGRVPDAYRPLVRDYFEREGGGF